MLEGSLAFIRSELLSYLNNDIQDGEVEVVLGNIALFETENANAINERIVITLVNIEEESTLKNSRNVHYGLDGGVRYTAQPIFLNLYLLFSCNYNSYSTALQRLSNIIRFFQQRRKFDIKSASGEQNENTFQEQEKEFKLIFELYTLTFEQINHLWGALGGRQLPSVMFKARLVKIEDSSIFKQGPPIQEVQGNSSLFNEY